MAIFKNWVPNIEFLDDHLRICGNNYILQKSLCIILPSIEMIPTSRLFSILNVAVFFNGADKAVSAFLTTYLEDIINGISSFLCVSPDLKQVIQAYHKEFILAENHPKGQKERFCACIIKKYPNKYLMHIERASEVDRILFVWVPCSYLKIRFRILNSWMTICVYVTTTTSSRKTYSI